MNKKLPQTKTCLAILALFCTLTFSGYSQMRNPKRGIAYGNLSEADLNAISKGVSWWYNWYYQPESGVADVYQNYNMDFVPMAWNGSFNEAGMRAFYASHPEAKYLLGFNEPNFISQANMTPKQAAALWPKLEAIADDYGLKIVSPAVNYCGSCVSEGGVTFTNPYQYLDSFFAACPDCRVDYIGVHNYMCYSGALGSYVDGFKKYGKKIWLTEFACWDQSNITLAMQKSYIMGALDLLDNDTMIFRYAWFTGDRSGSYPYLDIFKPQPGTLSELGDLYVNYNAFHDTSYYYDVPARIEAESYSQMYGIAIEGVTDFDGMADVGWIDAGDWLQYNVNVPEDGIYYVYLRIASNSATSVLLRENGNAIATYGIPNSGGWQNWRTYVQQVSLSAGHHKLQLYAPTGGFNVNWIKISDRSNSAPTLTVCANQIISLPLNSIQLSGIGEDSDGDSLMYKWVKSSGPANGTIVNNTADTTDVTGLTAGTYIFTLSVFDGFDVSSKTVTITVQAASGIEDLASDNSLYPNPVLDKLHISTTDFHRGTIILVIDQTGRELIRKKYDGDNSSYEINLQGLASGIYLIRIINDNEIKNYKVLKQ